MEAPFAQNCTGLGSIRTGYAGGTNPGARLEGVPVWIPPGEPSVRPSGRSPPGSRKNCHYRYGPPPFSGFARVAQRCDGVTPGQDSSGVGGPSVESRSTSWGSSMCSDVGSRAASAAFAASDESIAPGSGAWSSASSGASASSASDSTTSATAHLVLVADVHDLHALRPAAVAVDAA